MKAQVKMGESIVILIIFFFLIVFGMVFYVRFSISQHEKKSEEFKDLVAIETVQKVQFLPELQCTVEGNDDYNCIDLLKIQAIQSLSENDKKIYGIMFPRTKVIVEKVFPATPAENWDLYGQRIADTTAIFFQSLQQYMMLQRTSICSVIST